MSTVALEKAAPATAVRCAVVLEDAVEIPGWVVDLESFRRWVGMEEFPETGRICFLQGRVWVDMSWEQIFTHNDVKTEIGSVVRRLAKARRGNRFFGDGLRLTSVAADFSVIPDGTFVGAASWDAARVRLVPGKQGGFIELEGIPDMVLEVVSASSVKKDTVVLRQAYWEAGIPEYWLVDARRDPLHFDILRHGTRGYVAAKKRGGWAASAVFGKAFRLRSEMDGRGNPNSMLKARY